MSRILLPEEMRVLEERNARAEFGPANVPPDLTQSESRLTKNGLPIVYYRIPRPEHLDLVIATCTTHGHTVIAYSWVQRKCHDGSAYEWETLEEIEPITAALFEVRREDGMAVEPGVHQLPELVETHTTSVVRILWAATAALCVVLTTVALLFELDADWPLWLEIASSTAGVFCVLFALVQALRH